MFTINEIREKALPVAKDYKIKSLKLFGSYAKGSQNDNSDVDFIVEKGEMQTLFQYISFVDKLEEIFRCHVDVVSTESEDRDSVRKIEKDGILIYGG